MTGGKEAEIRPKRLSQACAAAATALEDMSAEPDQSIKPLGCGFNGRVGQVLVQPLSAVARSKTDDSFGSPRADADCNYDAGVKWTALPLGLHVMPWGPRICQRRFSF